MAVSITTIARNAACNAIVDLLDVGVTDANGDLVLMAAADAQVATLAFANPAFGAAAVGVAVANPISSDTNATGGTVIAFKMQDRNNAELLRGSVTLTAGGGDMLLSSVVVGPTDTVAVSSFTVTMLAA